MGRGTRADRRQSTRYATKSDLFLVFCPSLDRVGTLKDLSYGGATFEYAVFSKTEEVAYLEVDIFASSPNSLLLRRVPSKVIYDIRVERPTLIGIETRRCGLRFKHLSPQHRELLDILLSQYVSHALPVRYTAGKSSLFQGPFAQHQAQGTEHQNELS